jgi:hypothetical protein
MIRRFLGDLLGLLTLASLVASLVYVWPGNTTPDKFKELFPSIYILFAMSGYACWLVKERTMPNESWLVGAMWSIAGGIISLAGDILIGHLFNPSVPIIRAPLSAGIPFAVTLILCPGLTFICVAGWARSLVVRHRRGRE